MRRTAGRILLGASAVGAVMFLAAIPRADAQSAGDFRTWTDASGRYKVEARFSAQEGEIVILEKRDGGKLRIAIDKLSKDDRAFLEQLQQQNPFEPAEASPFEAMPGPGTGAAPGGATPSAAPPADMTGFTVDWSQVPMLSLPADGTWQYKAAGAAAPTVAERTVMLPPKRDFFEKINGCAINPAAMQGVVSYALDRPGGNEASSRLVKWDLRSGQGLGAYVRSGKWAVLALDDDGGKVLVRSDEFGFGKQGLLELWALRGQECVPLASWRPHPDAWAGNGDLKWAAFLDAKTFATCSGGGNLVLWDAATCRPVAQITIQGACVPALRDDRAWLAFIMGERLCLLDVAKREVTAVLAAPRQLNFPNLAFSPSGKKLVCADQKGLVVWNLADARLEAEFSPSGVPITGPVIMPDDDFVLLNRQTLVSIGTQVNVWQYTGAEAVATLGGVTFLVTGGMNGPGAVAAAKLPHAAARQTLEKALKQPDLFIFRKGVSVQLDVSAIPAAEQARVRDALTEKLATMDIRVVSQAPVVVAAGVDPPQRKEVSFHMRGDYKVTEHVAWVRIRYEGKDVWQSRGTNIPMVVMLKDGENLEGVLREKSKGPDYSFFANVSLPQYLQKPQGTTPGRPQGGQTLGTSQVTTSGI